MENVEKPKYRSKLRLHMGMKYYGFRRKLLWRKMKKVFANKQQKELLPYVYFSHKSILRRKLKDVDIWMQENKIKNLKIAIANLNGILLEPNEIFSYWKLIGHPTKRKGYVNGMVLINGTVQEDIGGGLCQLSNLIFWMSIHTPLSVVERHRHGFDVFPDANRTQPFGSGATCFYPHGDLMIQNTTQDTYQLILEMDDTYLKGEWRLNSKPKHTYEIIEKKHEMMAEYWGGYTRHNELYQQIYDCKHELLSESLIVKNSAIMMYSPFLQDMYKKQEHL